MNYLIAGELIKREAKGARFHMLEKEELEFYINIKRVSNVIAHSNIRTPEFVNYTLMMLSFQRMVF